MKAPSIFEDVFKLNQITSSSMMAASNFLRLDSLPWAQIIVCTEYFAQCLRNPNQTFKTPRNPKLRIAFFTKQKLFQRHLNCFMFVFSRTFISSNLKAYILIGLACNGMQNVTNCNIFTLWRKTELWSCSLEQQLILYWIKLFFSLADSVLNLWDHQMIFIASTWF